ncbi:MAG TPA: tetratricopeptide repeat protein, partial [Anaerolineae bacterium]|nr:tetratricopeptide repeat protein [Anaerolineae bacterium]
MQAETEALFSRKSIRRALKNWRKVRALGQHPLARLQITARRRREAGYADAPGGRGVALQDLLRTGIDSLRPDSGDPNPLAKSWRAYLSLNEQYVHGRSPAYAAALLGVARRTYYDEQTAALDRLGDWLRRQEQRAAASLFRESGAMSGARRIPFMAPPPPPHPLVGRATLLKDLKQQLLNSNASPRLALCGLPGVGKSSLANALANDPAVRDRFEDGVLWAGLGWQPDVLALLGVWGQALGLSADELAKQKSVAGRAQMIHNFIGLRRMLLVIDDAWQAEAALAFILGGPNCAHLITTRQPEVALPVAGNGVVNIDELDLPAGIALLTRLAPQAMQAEPPAAEALVQMVGGLPLGLTLLGKYLLHESHSGQPRRLRAALNRLQQVEARLRLSQPQPPLTAQPSLTAETPLSLQTAIGISDAVLDPSARRVWYALSLFPPKPNTFSEAAALATAQPSGESPLSPAVLDRLVDAGLLEASGPGRYTLHQTIADYARAKLQNSSARRAACLQMAAFYTRFVDASAGDNAAIDPEINNALAALEAVHRQGQNTALAQLAIALYPYLESRGLYAVAKTYARRAWQAAGEMNDAAARITANRQWGNALLFLGDPKKAEAALQKGLALAREFGDEKQIAMHLLSLGAVSLHRGDYAQAEARWQESLTLAYQLEDNDLITDILINLGSLY